MDNINKLLNIDKTKAKMNRTQPCLYYKSKPYYALHKQAFFHLLVCFWSTKEPSLLYTRMPQGNGFFSFKILDQIVS